MTNATAMEPTPPGGDGWRTELRATLRLSWPLAAANLLQMLTYAIDVIFIARLGEDQLAASALAIALSGRAGLVRRGGWAFILGVLVFSGCLYAMAVGAPRWLGAIVPLGGLSFLAGWALVAAGATRR